MLTALNYTFNSKCFTVFSFLISACIKYSVVCKFTNSVEHNRFCESENCISGVKQHRGWDGKNTSHNPVCGVTTLPHTFKENDSTKTLIHNRSFKKACLKRLRSVRLSGGVICRLWVLYWNEHRLLQEICVQLSLLYPPLPHSLKNVLIFYA
jgi:hypothetical protein